MHISRVMFQVLSFSLLLIVPACNSTNVFTNKTQNGDDLSLSGWATLKDKTIDNLKASGLMTVENCTIGSVVGSGSLKLLDSEIKNDIKFSGSCTMNNTTVLGTINASGYLKADRCQLNDICIATMNVDLVDCIAKNIIVKHQDKNPVLNLVSTRVQSVTFEGRTGTVVLESGAFVVGDVINGSIK